MEIVEVNSAKNKYSVCVANGFDDIITALSSAGLTRRRTVVVSDDIVAPLYLSGVRERIASVSEYYAEIIIKAGESAKSFSTLEAIYNFMIDNRLQRDSIVVALGGSVVSDVTGFAAATYMRGIPCVALPTTLLSMCDGSIGGKTGVDIGSHKNVVGAFSSPALVYSNVDTLQTLPRREFASGMAEAVKHAFIRDASYMEWIRANLCGIREKDAVTLERLVTRSCEIKAGVVAQDEFECKEIREILNFGHTFGHAIEGLSEYKLRHGECVSIGMAAALGLSHRLGFIESAEARSSLELMEALELPTHISSSDFTQSQVYDLMLSDKKVLGGKLRLVLLTRIGEPLIYTPTRGEVLLGLSMIMKTGDMYGMGKQ